MKPKLYVSFLIVFLLLLIALPKLPTPAGAESSAVAVVWVGKTQLYQGNDTHVTVVVTNNSPVPIFLSGVMIHYGWLPQNAFNAIRCNQTVQPNASVSEYISDSVPPNAKLETSNDFACYVKYSTVESSGAVNSTVLYTSLVRPQPVTISPGKSIYVKQVLSLDAITAVCVVFFSVCAVLYGRRKDIAQWLETHKGRIPALLFSLSLAVYLVFLLMNYTPYLQGVVSQQGFPITGDEPHYILATRALQFGKIDGDSIYGGMAGFFRHTKPSTGLLNYGQEVLSHPYGLPLISVIPYFLGQALFHSGVFGALAFVCMLVAIIGVLIYKISMFLTGGGVVVSVITSVTFSFATDLFMWSGQFFTEIVMSFLIILFVYKILTAKTKADWTVGGIVLGLLPFFKFQGVFVSVGCLILLSLLYLKGNKMTKYPIMSLSITTSIFLLYMHLFFGITNVIMLGSSYSIIDPTKIINIFGYDFNKVFYFAAFGLILDRNYGILFYSPILILSLLGIFQLLKRKNPAVYLSIFIFVFWLGAISNSTDWMGWLSVPGRYMIVILPLLSLPFSLGLVDFIKNKFYIGSYVLLFLAGLVPNAIIASNRVFGYVAYISNNGDYNWYMNGLESIGFRTVWWTADFNNFAVSDNNFRMVLVCISVFVAVSLALLGLSYKKAHV